MAKAEKKKIEMLNPNDLIIVGLDTKDGPSHELYDERAVWPVDEALVKDILLNGVIHPILLREIAGDLYVVDGRQRVKAARVAADRSPVPLLVKTMLAGTADALAVLGFMISSNEHRKEDSPLVRARKAARMQNYGASVDQIAIHFGVTATAIRTWFQVLEGSPKLLDFLKLERIGMAAALEISRYPKDEQGDVLEALFQVSKGQRISQAMAKAYRRKDGASAGSTPSAGASQGKKKNQQSGVRRVWLRKALESEAGKKLEAEHPERFGVLRWVSTGLSNEDDWFSKFTAEVETELKDKPKRKNAATKLMEKMEVEAPEEAPAVEPEAPAVEEEVEAAVASHYDSEEEEELEPEEVDGDVAAIWPDAWAELNGAEREHASQLFGAMKKYPSQSKAAAELGWTRHKVRTVLAGLKELGIDLKAAAIA